MQQPKGQSAIEYLATYGWMLLVVAIVGGSIFTTVQNSADIQSVSGLNNAEVRVSNYGLSEDGLQFSLRSAAAEQVNIRKIIVTDPETGVSADINPSKVVAIGDTANFKLKDVQRTDTSDTYDLEFTYDVGGLTGKVAGGKIKGRFGVFNRISLENADFNRSTNKLQIDVKNTGDNTTESINYTIKANNTVYNGSISNLDAGETAQINVSTDKTYPLESVNLDTQGHQFVDSSSGLKCTPTEGLVGYWTFNDEQTKNGYAIDLSGQQNNGSLENGVTIGTEGQVGEAYKFDGKDGYVSVVDDSSIDFAEGDLTVSLWMKSESLESRESLIKKKEYEIEENSGWLIYPRFGNLETRVSDGSSQIKLVDSQSEWETGTWRYLTLVLSQGNHKSLYRNSNKVISESFGTFTLSNNKDLIIGEEGGNFNGSIDQIHIYNRSLSQNEIRRLYNVRSDNWAVSGCKLTG